MPHRKNLRILSIAQDSSRARLFQTALQPLGFLVDFALNESEGLCRLSMAGYDLILFDQTQPAEGKTPIAPLACGQGALPPLLVLVNRGEERAAIEAVKLGAGDYMVKDEAGNYLELLPLSIERLLEKRRLQREKELAEKSLEQTLKELQTSRDELNILIGMTQLLHSSPNETGFSEVVESYLPFLFPHLTGALYFLPEDETEVKLALSWGGEAHSRPTFTLDQCQAVQRRMPHAVRPDKPLASPCAHIANPDKDSSYLCMPLIAGREPLGLLHLQAKRPTAEQDAAVVDPVAAKTGVAIASAENISLALSNIRLRLKLREQAIKDILTGLYNRRYMEESLEREMARSRRTKKPWSLILFDVDFFKRFNDSYGHEAGDAVLASLGRLLLDKKRGEDIPCRFGGEEIILILLDCDHGEAFKLAERLRRDVEVMPVEYQGQDLPQVTCSIGVATFPDHGDSFPEIIAAADKALYRAKDSGRNRVCGQD